MFNKYNHLMSEQSKGVSASILCSLLFALIPAYVQLQPDMAPSLIAGGDSHWLAVQRIFWSTLLFGALLLLTKRLPLLIEALKERKQWGRYLLSAILVAPQYWLFVWAPANGETLNLALGYFTLPIVMVLVGRFVYQESLTRLQKVACLFALLGTIWAYALSSGVSWVVLVVALGYPLYFINRKSIPLAADVGLAVDHIILLPFAIAGMFFLYPVEYFLHLPVSTYFYYVGLAVVAVTPMLLYLYAYSKLTVSLFGLLGYVEPTFIFIVGLLIGDTIALNEMPTYLFIIFALVALVADGYKRMRSSRALRT
ncbi:EamA family transporter RarD [Vibrio rhodolitus]|uniref:EamA family transporter RarD n=1 Tax=Vibrio rhodolitus TaxID=2231649 RepID=UPI000E0C034D|nr:EamA family transporter RarD [Vibrio rhodolitus]